MNNLIFEKAKKHNLLEIVNLYNKELSFIKNRENLVSIEQTIIAKENNKVIAATGYKILNKEQVVKALQKNKDDLKIKDYIKQDKYYGFLHNLVVDNNYKKQGIATKLNKIRIAEMSNYIDDIYGILWSKGQAYNIMTKNGFKTLYTSKNHWYLDYDNYNYCRYCGNRCYCNAIIIYKNLK